MYVIGVNFLGSQKKSEYKINLNKNYSIVTFLPLIHWTTPKLKKRCVAISASFSEAAKCEHIKLKSGLNKFGYLGIRSYVVRLCS